MNLLYNYSLFFKLLSFCIIILMSSCGKDEILTSQSYSLSFSSSSIDFDTIFTNTGSITRQLKIYNKNPGTIHIDSLFFSKNSDFFMNVNGMPGKSIHSISIREGDSVFVFIQCFLSENNVDTTVFRGDSLGVTYNKKNIFIPINVAGQDVIYLNEGIHKDVTLHPGKPYIIKDSLVINKNSILTIEAGTRLFLHKGANIIINGSLTIDGTIENPVIINSHRIEQAFQNTPGQWGSIIFNSSSRNNKISGAIIKNGVNGLLVYGNSEKQVDINIHNTYIQNMSASTLFAINGAITASNSVFSNANRYIMALQGGSYSFTHITISNQGTLGGRDFLPSVRISDFDLSSNDYIALTEVNFKNSIIVGRLQNEIQTMYHSDNLNHNLLFSSCIVRTSLFNTKPEYFSSSYEEQIDEPLFKSIHSSNFTLDSLSQAINKGNMDYALNIPTDIAGNSRKNKTQPDIGAYEYTKPKD